MISSWETQRVNWVKVWNSTKCSQHTNPFPFILLLWLQSLSPYLTFIQKENKYPTLLDLPGVVCLNSVCVWMTNILYYCTVECNRAPHVKSFPPPPTSLCPPPSLHPLASSASLPLLTSLFYPPFPLLPWVSLGLKVGTRPINTTTGSPNLRWWRRGAERAKAHITTQWPTYTSTQLIESNIEACGQSQVGVECKPANGSGHSPRRSSTVSIQFSVIIVGQGERGRREGEKREPDG